jgi:hypothetical protein
VTTGRTMPGAGIARHHGVRPPGGLRGREIARLGVLRRSALRARNSHRRRARLAARGRGAEKCSTSLKGVPDVVRSCGTPVRTAVLVYARRRWALCRAPCRCADLGSADMRGAGRLIVDWVLHAVVIVRFDGDVVCGVNGIGLHIWTGAIGAHGYLGFGLTRDGVGLYVRRHPYASTIAGGSVAAGVREFARMRQPGARQYRGRDKGATAGRGRRPGRHYDAHGAGASQHCRGLSHPPNVEACGASSRWRRCRGVHGWDGAAVHAALLGANRCSGRVSVRGEGC